MSYQLVIDFSPVYELISSFYHYVDFKQHKSFLLDKEWREQTKKSLSATFAAELEDGRWEVLHRINLLVWQCPGERTPDGFLHWLEQQPPGELYERLSPWAQSLPGNLRDIRDRTVFLLSEWNRQYFSRCDQDILAQMKAHSERLQQQSNSNSLSPIDLVEEATNGLRLEPTLELKTVFLIPQYHCFPSSIIDYFESICVCLYPFEPTTEQGNPPVGLINMTQALADENRLKILRYIWSAPRTFSEVQTFIGLAKSTTNHHLNSLRRAGLIRSHYSSGVTGRYSIRESAVKRLQVDLDRYLHGGAGS